MLTEKEIELAKQLKKVGLEWKPSFGDMVLIKDELLTREYRNKLKWRGLVEGAGTHDKYFTGIVIGTLNLPTGEDIEVAVWDSRRWIASFVDTTWLPNWHQCRKILLEANIELTISDMPSGTNVTLTLWRRYPKNGIEFYRQIITDTDLEAMYKALLGVLNNVS